MKNEFTDSFIEEASALLMQLEDNVMELEKNPDDCSVINKIFRVMHTLKGSAGMIGFYNIQDLTHEFESLFDLVRIGQLTFNKGITDLTLRGKDQLMDMLKGSENKESVKDLIDRIRQLTTKGEPGPEEREEPEASGSQYFLWFKPVKTIFERGLDPDRVISEIQSSGKLHIILHEGETTWQQQKQKKICSTCWEIYLNTSMTAEEVADIFLFYHEEEFKVLPVKDLNDNPDPELIELINYLYKGEKDARAHLKSCFESVSDTDTDTDNDSDNDSVIYNQLKAIAEQPVANNSGNVQPDPGKKRNESTINVSSHKLDELMNLVSELVTITDVINVHLTGSNDQRLNNAIENIEKLTKKFRNNALDLRLVPVGSLFAKLKRPVRDLSIELDKRVNLLIEGMEIEIDKTILNSIESPLKHIIRNSIDHGIESAKERLEKGKTPEGLLKITAFYSGASVIIQVQDDGRGIDLDRVKECALRRGLIQSDQSVTKEELIGFIMEPGFTTAENVSMVSGRGVGMDVVRKELGLISGSLEVYTEKDLGTSITMKLPATLTIIDTLMIDTGETRVLIPVMDIEYCFKATNDELFNNDNRYINYKNQPIPLVSLRNQFSYPELSGEQMVIVINKFERRYAITADRIIGEHQAVIKPLGSLFVNQPYFSGGSIMVDGKLALILDTNFLFNHISKMVLS